MSLIPPTDSRSRLNALRKLLTSGEISTQEELAEELNRQKYHVTQSTISRDLRKLGAIKTFDPAGQIVYRLPDDVMIPSVATAGLKGLLIDIQHNGVMIVLHTTPGSASLVARHLDQVKPDGIIGTMAGDDTIFIAPASIKKIEHTVKAIMEELS
jgi:transcriptional regulator of arginine metabolism